MRELRQQHFGERSSSLLAGMLSKMTGYKVYQEHVSSYEKGERFLSDSIVEALAKIFGTSPTIFPQYAARHIEATKMTHPLVAWAMLASDDMTEADGEKFVRRTEKIRGKQYSPLLIESLKTRGVRSVAMPVRVGTKIIMGSVRSG